MGRLLPRKEFQPGTGALPERNGMGGGELAIESRKSDNWS